MQQASPSLPTNSRVRVAERVVRIQKRLGNGAFGVVYKVTDEATSKVYALKDVFCSYVSEIRNAIREARTLSRISHENVIAVLGADQFSDTQGLHMLILTEYCGGGNLNERLARASSDSVNSKWMRQMAAALAYLHSSRVVHRDLKPDNVLLTAIEDVKLADFGLSREYIALQRTGARDSSWMTSYTQYYMQSGVGTPYWMAPEVFSGRYNEKADVFSLGAIFYAILERDFIMADGKSYYGAFKRIPGVGTVGLGYAKAKFDPRSHVTFSSRAQGSNGLQKIALDALHYDKNDRPSAREIHDRIVSIPNSTKIQVNIRLDSRHPLVVSRHAGKPKDLTPRANSPVIPSPAGARPHTPPRRNFFLPGNRVVSPNVLFPMPHNFTPTPVISPPTPVFVPPTPVFVPPAPVLVSPPTVLIPSAPVVVAPPTVIPPAGAAAVFPINAWFPN